MGWVSLQCARSAHAVPTQCPRSAHAVRTQCKLFALVNTILRDAWGSQEPMTNKPTHLFQQPAILEAVLGGTLCTQLFRILHTQAPNPKATAELLQLTAIRKADAQLRLRLCMQHYTHLVIHAIPENREYYNKIIHYKHREPTNLNFEITTTTDTTRTYHHHTRPPHQAPHASGGPTPLLPHHMECEHHYAVSTTANVQPATE